MTILVPLLFTTNYKIPSDCKITNFCKKLAKAQLMYYCELAHMIQGSRSHDAVETLLQKSWSTETPQDYTTHTQTPHTHSERSTLHYTTHTHTLYTHTHTHTHTLHTPLLDAMITLIQ